MSAVAWPDEPVRPAGALPDEPLVVLIRAHYPRITYNIVASAGSESLREEDRRHGHLWYVSRHSSSYSWPQIPEKVLLLDRLVRVEVFTLGVLGGVLL